MVRRARRAILFPPNENLQRSSPGSCLATIPPGGPRCGRERPDEPTRRLRGRRRGARRGGLRAPPPGRRRAVLPREARLRHPRRGRRPLPHRPRLPLLPRGLALQGREDRRRGPALALAAPAGPGSPRSPARCLRGPNPTWRPGAASSASCGSTCPLTPWPRSWA